MNELTFDKIRNEIFILSKSTWPYIVSMVGSLSYDEFNKIPEIKSDEQKKFCELYAICDMINTDKNKYTYIYSIGSYIFRGETKEYINN